MIGGPLSIMVESDRWNVYVQTNGRHCANDEYRAIKQNAFIKRLTRSVDTKDEKRV